MNAAVVVRESCNNQKSFARNLGHAPRTTGVKTNIRGLGESDADVGPPLAGIMYSPEERDSTDGDDRAENLAVS